MFSLPLLRHRVTWGVPSAPGESGLAAAAALGLLGSTLWACGGPCGLPALNEDEAAVTESGHVSDLSGRVLIFFATTVRCARSIDPSSPLPSSAELLACSLRSDATEGVTVNFDLQLAAPLLDGSARTLQSGSDFTISAIHYQRSQTSTDSSGATLQTTRQLDLTAAQVRSDLSLAIAAKGSKQLPAPDAQLTGQICQVDGQSSFALGFNLAWLSLP